MKTSTLFTLFASVALSSLLPSVIAIDVSYVANVITANAAADGINLGAVNFLDAALAEITTVYNRALDLDTTKNISQLLSRRDLLPRDASTIGTNGPPLAKFLADGKRIDLHAHVIPPWFSALAGPTTGGNPTPQWDLDSHLKFLASEGIDRAILSFSTPGANVFPGEKDATVTIARLINEQNAAYRAAFPNKFKFFAAVPLPFVQEAITEAQYALSHLGAAGIALFSNHEGIYLGDPQFKPFFQAVNAMKGKKVIFIHPTKPVIKTEGGLVEANPTRYPTGRMEFYFETARTLIDLTLTKTLHDFPTINYLIPHTGGAFPSVMDRILKSEPTLYDSSLQIYRTRVWWDSAGPTYFHQVSGLLGDSIPKSQLVFGTDFPYAPLFTQAGSLGAILSSPLLSSSERVALFSTDARKLFTGVNA